MTIARPPKPYRPTRGDLAYRDAPEDIDPFNEARLLRRVSHEYLATLAHGNSGPTSAGFRAMIDAEVARRGSALARRANWIASAALVVAIIALFR